MNPHATPGAPSPVGGLAEAFASEAQPITRFWPAEPGDDDGHTTAVTAEHAAAVTAAVAQALAGDVAPLCAVLGLDGDDDQDEGAIGRLDAALRHLDAIRRVAVRRPRLRMDASVDEIDAAFAAVVRQVAVHTAATLAARAAAAAERVRSGGDAMLVTLHELRRPLTVLSGYSQLFGNGVLGQLSEKGASAAAAMVSATEAMLRLTDTLDTLARLEDPTEPVQLHDVEIADVVDAAIAEASTAASLTEVRFDTRVARNLSVNGDRERLVTAVTNLLSNAVTHSPPGSTVAVRGFRAGRHAHVVVRDQGSGFPPESAERLFEKYYRDPGERERGIPGTGLGLFIVLTVAQRHHGSASARLADGGGAEFVLTLPALPGKRRVAP